MPTYKASEHYRPLKDSPLPVEPLPPSTTKHQFLVGLDKALVLLVIILVIALLLMATMLWWWRVIVVIGTVPGSTERSAGHIGGPTECRPCNVCCAAESCSSDIRRTSQRGPGDIGGPTQRGPGDIGCAVECRANDAFSLNG